MLRAQRQYDGVVTGRSLKLEIERNAEPFAQGEPEGPVHPAPEGRVDDQLHAAAVVEETLEHHVLYGRQDSQLLEPR